MCDYKIGDIVEMKKPHPCGCGEWEVLRVGADFKIKCTGCSHIVMIPRSKFEKSVKRLIQSSQNKENT